MNRHKKKRMEHVLFEPLRCIVTKLENYQPKPNKIQMHSKCGIQKQ